MDHRQENINNTLTDCDLKSALDSLHELNSCDNILSQLDIDSKYYEVDQINSITSDQTIDYKYKIMHINIQGLTSSLENLKHLLHKLELNDIQLDFVLICETFLHGTNHEEMANHCNIPGYTFVCNNRITKMKGGVGIYVNDIHQFKIRSDISTFIEGEYESLFIEIIAKPCNAIVGKIYRITNTAGQLSIKRYEDTITDIINHKSHDILIGSDQNFDYIKINEHRNTADLFNMFLSNELIPVITKPTRITHNSATLIDNLYIRLHQTRITSGIITTKLSDHLPIFAFYGKSPKTKSKPVNINFRNFNESNISLIKHEIEHYDWSALKSQDSNIAYDTFLNIINRAIDKVAPMKTINISNKRANREPWITKGILKSSKTVR